MPVMVRVRHEFETSVNTAIPYVFHHVGKRQAWGNAAAVMPHP